MSERILLSAHYFPCIAYFAYLLKYPKAYIDTGEHFLKQSYRNRCHIYTSNGLLTMSIPVIKRNNTSMNEVLIDNKEDWKKKHWRAINSAYSSSPFFEFYCDNLEKTFFKDYEKLSDLNSSLLHHICEELEIPKQFQISQTYLESTNLDVDLRDRLHPKKSIAETNDFPRYIQTFESKFGFKKNLSILDLLFHEGPESTNYLKKLLK